MKMLMIILLTVITLSCSNETSVSTGIDSIDTTKIEVISHLNDTVTISGSGKLVKDSVVDSIFKEMKKDTIVQDTIIENGDTTIVEKDTTIVEKDTTITVIDTTITVIDTTITVIDTTIVETDTSLYVYLYADKHIGYNNLYQDVYDSLYKDSHFGIPEDYYDGNIIIAVFSLDSNDYEHGKSNKYTPYYYDIVDEIELATKDSLTHNNNNEFYLDYKRNTEISYEIKKNDKEKLIKSLYTDDDNKFYNTKYYKLRLRDNSKTKVWKVDLKITMLSDKVVWKTFYITY